ncbi:Oleate hydroxylase fah12 [Pestalotiopsis sp. IQ-011]
MAVHKNSSGQSVLTARRGGAHSRHRRDGIPPVNAANSSRGTTDEFKPRDAYDGMGSEGRPIVLEDTEIPLQSSEKFNSGAEKVAERESVQVLDKSASVAEVTHAAPEKQETSPGREPLLFEPRVPVKRKATTKSPAFEPATQAWWLPLNRKIRLIEICIGFQREYFVSNDSELNPDQAF